MKSVILLTCPVSCLSPRGPSLPMIAQPRKEKSFKPRSSRQRLAAGDNFCCQSSRVSRSNEFVKTQLLSPSSPSIPSTFRSSPISWTSSSSGRRARGPACFHYIPWASSRLDETFPPAVLPLPGQQHRFLRRLSSLERTLISPNSSPFPWRPDHLDLC